MFTLAAGPALSAFADYSFIRLLNHRAGGNQSLAQVIALVLLEVLHEAAGKILCLGIPLSEASL